MTREEAINKLKHLCSPEQMTALKVLVPELQESEDERIRKEIIEYSKNCMTRAKNDYAYKMFSKWVAWLEKQK